MCYVLKVDLRYPVIPYRISIFEFMNLLCETLRSREGRERTLEFMNLWNLWNLGI